VWGDTGPDELHAGPGDDVVWANDRGRDLLIDCGPGVDTVHMDPVGARGSVSDRQLRRRGRVRGCEHVVLTPAPPRDPARGITWLAPLRGASKKGSARNDTLLGATGPDRIRGRHGQDVIWGNRLHGDRSTALDRLWGGPGADVVYGSPGRNDIFGEDGGDYLQGGAGSNRIFGGPGDDEIRLRGRGPNTVDAGPGDDVVHVYARRASRIVCGPGSDTAHVDKHDRVDGSCERVVRH
jgi:Ca2+-binding RTX toxin-like protein